MDKPKHIAFIMDGNRRWAKAHKFETLIGHNKGAERLETVVEFAAKQNIPFVTFWAFSTENWKRGEKEVAMLITVFRTILAGSMVKRLIKNGVKLKILGNYKAFPEDIVKGLESLMEESKDNTRITANIALNYGGRAEIVEAANQLLNEGVSNVTESDFISRLYTKDLPDPDMIVRTGGEIRLSGFLPWQSIYSELYFTEVLWPDFDENELEKALEEFAHRQRRFGK
jgi:undecaprenyl diphosphate synthase